MTAHRVEVIPFAPGEGGRAAELLDAFAAEGWVLHSWQPTAVAGSNLVGSPDAGPRVALILVLVRDGFDERHAAVRAEIEAGARRTDGKIL